MIVRLNGQFDSCAQPALHEAFGWIAGPVTIDLTRAWLGAAALAEVVLLTRRLGSENVSLVNLTPTLRRIVIDARMDRLLRIVQSDAPEPVSHNAHSMYVHRPSHRAKALSRTARAAHPAPRMTW